MLYQDTLTGMLHEVPDSQVYGLGYGEDPYGVGEAQMVYDGLGNPLGFSFKRAFSSIGKFISKAAPFATAILGPYGQIINRALPIVSRAFSSGRPAGPPMQNQAPPQFVPPQMEPEPAGAEIGEMPMVFSRPGGMYSTSMRPGMQAGWQPTPAGWRPTPAGWRPTPAGWRPTPAAMRPPMPAWMRPRIPAGWKRPQVPYTGVKPRRLYMRCAVWRGPGGLVPINPGQPAVAPAVPAAVSMGSGRHRSRGRRRR